LDRTEVTDIRGYFKYDFILNEDNEVMLRLKKKADSEKWIVLNLMKKNVEIPEDPTINYKYGTMENGEYQFNKQPIQFEKAQDIHSMRVYCNLLTEEEKQEWYPNPNKIQTTKEAIDEDLIMEYQYLEKRIVDDFFDQANLDDLTVHH